MDLFERIKRDEALRLYPYKCSQGVDTIFYGRAYKLNPFKPNEIEYMLENGVTKRTAEYCLRNDIKQAKEDMNDNYPWMNELDEVRKDVIINMIYNLGITKFRRFKKTIALIKANDFKKASVEMLDSLWAKQVGKRAIRLSKAMERGSW